MKYQDFNHLYAGRIWEEYNEEDVKESLGITFEAYMQLKYENFIEEMK